MHSEVRVGMSWRSMTLIVHESTVTVSSLFNILSTLEDCRIEKALKVETVELKESLNVKPSKLQKSALESNHGQ